eukprot:324312_1
MLFDSQVSQDRHLLLTQFMAIILDGQSYRDDDDVFDEDHDDDDDNNNKKVFHKMEIVMLHHKPCTFTRNSRVLIFDYDYQSYKEQYVYCEFVVQSRRMIIVLKVAVPSNTSE